MKTKLVVHKTGIFVQSGPHADDDDLTQDHWAFCGHICLIFFIFGSLNVRFHPRIQGFFEELVTAGKLRSLHRFDKAMTKTI